MSIMTAYSSYDGIPAIANKRMSNLSIFRPITYCSPLDRFVDRHRRFSLTLSDIKLV